MSEEVLRFERALAKAQNRYVDDPLAINSFLGWRFPVGQQVFGGEHDVTDV